jgi:hypothetical protein
MSERDFWVNGFRPDAGPTTATKRALANVVETFQKWLYLKDPGVVYITIGTIAANYMESDPLWLLIVGPSGGGKTEAVNATERLPNVHLASTLTGPASLLSASPKHQKDRDSTGGLLERIGAFGILALKDFTSVLSMNRDLRAELLGALREIFDGRWTRHVGTDGGKTLTWEGKLGLIAGCTTAIDSHHAVMATMGERFLLYRLPEADGDELSEQALDNLGAERKMRAELAQSVSGFFAGLTLPDKLPRFEGWPRKRLVALANLVSMARSAVDRDGYTREIDLIHDTEAPTRIVQTLGRLYAGLIACGVDAAYAWTLTRKTGLDCIPKIRRVVFALLATAKDWQTTSDLAVAADYPTKTTLRAVEDLAAHKVVRRKKKVQGNADGWLLSDRARHLYEVATEMSVEERRDDPSINNPLSVLEDFSVLTFEKVSEPDSELVACRSCAIAIPAGRMLCETCEAEAARSL